MKIQIDTDKKVLRLESDVNLGEFMSKIKVLFPDGQWKEYKLETNVEIQWSNPIYIDRWVDMKPWVNPGPWVNPFIYCGGGGTVSSLTVNGTSTDSYTPQELGVYNVEC